MNHTDHATHILYAAFRLGDDLDDEADIEDEIEDDDDGDIDDEDEDDEDDEDVPETWQVQGACV